MDMLSLLSTVTTINAKYANEHRGKRNKIHLQFAQNLSAKYANEHRGKRNKIHLQFAQNLSIHELMARNVKVLARVKI